MSAVSYRTERAFIDGNGVSVRVRVDVDAGETMEREILRLANKARASRTLKYATSAGGVLRVTVLSETGKKTSE